MWSGEQGPYLQRARSVSSIHGFGSTTLSQINYLGGLTLLITIQLLGREGHIFWEKLSDLSMLI
jgi:hypothetical protein